VSVGTPLQPALQEIPLNHAGLQPSARHVAEKVAALQRTLQRPPKKVAGPVNHAGLLCNAPAPETPLKGGLGHPRADGQTARYARQVTARA
jgi:hypothetical protein